MWLCRGSLSPLTVTHNAQRPVAVTVPSPTRRQHPHRPAGPVGCFSGKSAPPVEIPPPLWVWGIFVPHDKKKHTPRLLTYPPGTGARVVGGGI